MLFPVQVSCICISTDQLTTQGQLKARAAARGFFLLGKRAQVLVHQDDDGDGDGDDEYDENYEDYEDYEDDYDYDYDDYYDDNDDDDDDNDGEKEEDIDDHYQVSLCCLSLLAVFKSHQVVIIMKIMKMVIKIMIITTMIKMMIIIMIIPTLSFPSPINLH